MFGTKISFHTVLLSILTLCSPMGYGDDKWTIALPGDQDQLPDSEPIYVDGRGPENKKFTLRDYYYNYTDEVWGPEHEEMLTSRMDGSWSIVDFGLPSSGKWFRDPAREFHKHHLKCLGAGAPTDTREWLTYDGTP